MAKYQMIAEWVKKRIEQGELKDGDRLESEHVLSRRFGISRQTVRHALGVLQEEGLLFCRQGSGNYVSLNLDDAAGGMKTVILISTYVNAYIFPNIIQGMEQVLARENYALQVMFTYDKVMTERKILEEILQMPHVKGLIVEPTQSALPNPNIGYYRELMERKIPIIFFHSYYESLPISHVSINDTESGRIATRYLIENGHKKIGGIFKLEDGQGHRRFSGYVQAMIEAGLAVDEEQVTWIDTQDERSGLTTCGEKILNRLEGCSACVCYNDSVAHGLTLLCRSRGIRIPHDMSVVSIDNSELAQLNTTPLTTVVHPMDKLGECVAQQFIKLVKNPQSNVTYEFPVQLVIRESVRRCMPS